MVQETIFSFPSTQMFSALGRQSMGMEHAALFLSTDFGVVVPKVSVVFERKYGLCGESKEPASIPDSATGLLGHLDQDIFLGVGFHS